jgi:hypothetical protein
LQEVQVLYKFNIPNGGIVLSTGTYIFSYSAQVVYCNSTMTYPQTSGILTAINLSTSAIGTYPSATPALKSIC